MSFFIFYLCSLGIVDWFCIITLFLVFLSISPTLTMTVGGWSSSFPAGEDGPITLAVTFTRYFSLTDQAAMICLLQQIRSKWCSTSPACLTSILPVGTFTLWDKGSCRRKKWLKYWNQNQKAGIIVHEEYLSLLLILRHLGSHQYNLQHFQLQSIGVR